MNKKPRRLTLNRETLHRLDESSLRLPKGGVVAERYPSEQMSPLCGPTYWEGCEYTQ